MSGPAGVPSPGRFRFWTNKTKPARHPAAAGFVVQRMNAMKHLENVIIEEGDYLLDGGNRNEYIPGGEYLLFGETESGPVLLVRSGEKTIRLLNDELNELLERGRLSFVESPPAENQDRKRPNLADLTYPDPREPKSLAGYAQYAAIMGVLVTFQNHKPKGLVRELMLTAAMNDLDELGKFVFRK